MTRAEVCAHAVPLTQPCPVCQREAALQGWPNSNDEAVIEAPGGVQAFPWPAPELRDDPPPGVVYRSLPRQQRRVVIYTIRLGYYAPPSHDKGLRRPLMLGEFQLYVGEGALLGDVLAAFYWETFARQWLTVPARDVWIHVVTGKEVLPNAGRHEGGAHSSGGAYPAQSDG